MILFFVSCLAFLLAGFGLGGGVLLIPVLTTFFDFSQIDAQYIALIAYIPAAIGVIANNFNKTKKHAQKIIKLIPLGILGSFAGGYIISIISVNLLKKLYSVFLILYGCYMIFNVSFSKFNKKTVKITEKA